MPDLTELDQWIDAHRGLAILAAVAVAVALLSLVGGQLWASYKGRTLTSRASALFAVVQGGVAYVTITGVYEFWEHVVNVPTWDAIGIAVIIEAVTWAAVADIYVHGATAGSTGMGRSGPLFWMSVTGGGIMAVAGSPGVAIAVGRAVVVALGAAMWHVRIRQKTRPSTQQSRWAITPKHLMLRWGLMIPDDTDVQHSSREYQIRTLTRAVHRRAEGGPWARRRGDAHIRRVMESGDAGMVREAQERYALQHVLRTEISPESDSMKAAIEAARLALHPVPPPAEEPPAEAAQEPEPTAEPEPEPIVEEPPRRKVPPARRTSAATAARANRDTKELKARAVTDAVTAIRAGETLTGPAWGARYGMREQWGRDRLGEARQQIAAEDEEHARAQLDAVPVA